MKGRKHTAEQVIRKLREGERLAADGRSVAEVARALEISEQTYSHWRNQYGGMKADDAKELRRATWSLTALSTASCQRSLASVAWPAWARRHDRGVR